MSINTFSGVLIGSELSLLPGSPLRRPCLAILGKPSPNRSNPDSIPNPGNCFSGLRSAGVGNPKAKRSGVSFTCCNPALGRRCSPGYTGLDIPNLHRPSLNPTGCAPDPGSCLWGSGVRGNVGNGPLRFGPVQGSESVLRFRIRINSIQIDSSQIDRDIFRIWSGSTSNSRGRCSSTSVSAVASTNQLITGLRSSLFRIISSNF